MHSSCILVSFNGVWVTVVHNIGVLLTYLNQLNVKGSYDEKQNFYSSRSNITMTKKSWKPLARRLKSNYRTHRLIPTCTDLIEYKATWLYYFLGIML